MERKDGAMEIKAWPTHETPARESSLCARGVRHYHYSVVHVAACMNATKGWWRDAPPRLYQMSDMTYLLQPAACACINHACSESLAAFVTVPRTVQREAGHEKAAPFPRADGMYAHGPCDMVAHDECISRSRQADVATRNTSALPQPINLSLGGARIARYGATRTKFLDASKNILLYYQKFSSIEGLRT
jgi:hypothetical protein